MSKSNLLPQGGFNRCVLAREGYVLYNANDVIIGRSIERYGEYSELEAQLLRQLCRPGSVVVEVGANIGTLTLVLARAAGPAGYVYAYEPQRIVYQTLCANIALNSLVNVDARQAAVGAAAGTVFVPQVDPARAANFGAVSVAASTSGQKVVRVTLDSDLALARLDLIKIDVEGMELDVLQGAATSIERFRPLLYLENDRRDRSEALIRHVLELDYRVYWHLPPLYNPDNFFGDRENLYPNIISVNMLGVPLEREQTIRGLPEVRDEADHPLKGRDPAPGGAATALIHRAFATCSTLDPPPLPPPPSWGGEMYGGK